MQTIVLPQSPVVQLLLNRAKYLRRKIDGGPQGCRVLEGSSIKSSVVLGHDVGDEESCLADKHRVSN